MSPLVATPALLLALTALARYAWIVRSHREGRELGFLDLPLGLAVSFRLELAPVAARERLRSQLLRTGVFSAVPQDDGRVAFHQGSRASPWFGRLWRPASPQVFSGSFVAERSDPNGSRILIRFSTVPVTGWALAAGAILIAYLLIQYALHQRGPWFWISGLALALAIRAWYQTEARRIAWHLLSLLDLERRESGG